MRFVEKLKSDKGVSILLALFLFLVCAAVGSVVLTAGTAAAGRRARIEATDQKYYGVISAAELFRDKITGVSVTMERKKTETYSTTFQLVKTNGISSRQDAGQKTASVFTYTNSLNDIPFDSVDLLQKVVQKLVKDYDTETPANYGYDSPIKRYTEETEWSFTLVHDPDRIPEGVSADDLKVDVLLVIEENGDLTFTFSSGSEQERYAVKEKYRLRFEETVENKSVDGPPSIMPKNGSDTEYTEQYDTTVTTVKTGTFCWEYQGVETVVAVPAESSSGY